MKAGNFPMQRARLLAQVAFFCLFVLTPVFDLFRYDLREGHAYFLTMRWDLGLTALQQGQLSAGGAARNILLFLFLPILGVVAAGVGIAWKWGRLYCGWLCPHFSVVETLNRLMIRAIGKHSVWDRQRLPARSPAGGLNPRHPAWWLVIVPLAIAFAVTWAVVLLTYLMPPWHVYAGLLHGGLGRGEVIFLVAASSVLTLEFLFARHLFCRFACAIGLFQSLVWMGNREALVVGCSRERLQECADCLGGEGSACDAVCPMRLKPRNIKRWMFTCTQCTQCISACETVNRDKPQGALLHWVKGEAARQNEAGFSALTRERG
jgi:polyferredoxin